MRFKWIPSIILVAMLAAACGDAPSEEYGVEEDEFTDTSQTKEASEARVFFKNMKSGDTIVNPVIVEMGVEGMKLEPAGMVKEGTGHHHLVIDGSFIEEGTVIPTGEKSIHYGNAQTSDTLELESGMHVLTLQYGDGMHRSMGEPMSATIEVYVKGGSEQTKADTTAGGS